MAAIRNITPCPEATPVAQSSSPKERARPSGRALLQCRGTFSTDGALAGELKVSVPPNWLMPA